MVFSTALLLVGLAQDQPASARYRIYAECDESSAVAAQVAKDAPLKISYSIAGSPTCYAVSAEVDGKIVRGYVTAGALDSVTAFDSARRANEREAFSHPPPVPAQEAPAPPPAEAKEAVKEVPKVAAAAPPKPKPVKEHKYIE